MRKWNLFFVIGMLVTFLLHGIMGSLKLAGADADAQTTVAWISVGFLCGHVIISSILTGKSLHARRLSGAGYFRDNQLFWIRRISGLLILIPLVLHLLVFRSGNAGAFRLQVFTTGRLISQLLLVAAIALHVLTNVKPALISMGVRDTKSFSRDLIMILAFMLLLFGIAFAIYYTRWMSL